MATYKELVNGVRATFMTGKTQSYEWRSKQLYALIKMMEEQKQSIIEALHKDLHKPESEVLMAEIDFVKNDATFVLNNLKDWMKPQKVSRNIMTAMDDAYIRYEPLGVALIIGAWNFPLQLTLGPMVGALAAGNCVVLKPSELSASTANFLEQTCGKYLDTDCVKVVNGGVPETTALLNEKFDHIFYTGNSQVARVVYEAAAKHLTPVILELGGKSPVYVDESSDLDVVSKRLLWGKFMNAGQTCIAPDYVMCNQKVQDSLIEKCKVNLKSFYGENAAESNSFARIVNGRHFKRVSSLLTSSKGRIVIGGSTDEKTNYIEPTLVVDVKPDDSLMREEVFGPVLPFVSVKNVDEAIGIINKGEKPLALYVFSKDNENIDKLVKSTSSGGVTINDTIMHSALRTLPFGGVGCSGQGAYHGKFTFEAFSHRRGCLVRKQAMEKLNDMRYPPYSSRKIALMTWFMKESPRSPYSKLWTATAMVVFGVLIGFLLKTLI